MKQRFPYPVMQQQIMTPTQSSETDHSDDFAKQSGKRTEILLLVSLVFISVILLVAMQLETLQARLVFTSVAIGIFTWVYLLNRRSLTALNNALANRDHDVAELHRKQQQLLSKYKKIKREKLQAQRASDTKNAFLANVSHEFRTPLTAIIGFAESLISNPSAQLDREQRESIATILGNGQHLLALINDILDISRIEADKLTIQQIRTSTVELLEQLRATMQHQAQAKQLNFSIVYDYPIPSHFAIDKTRLRQILVNLCCNAIKFTHQGFVQVRVAWQESRQMLVFSVLDSGIGIHANDQDRIFKPFSQVGNSHMRNNSGLGLGLFISQKLAKLLGGRIELQSEQGQGCRFQVSIPFYDCDNNRIMCSADQQPQDCTQDKPQTVPNSLSGSVLIAEDTIDNQQLLKKLLAPTGLQVEIVDDGQQALDRLSQRDYGLIFMDIQMPNLDGIEATQQLRQQGIQTPIIAISANAIQEEQHRAHQAGCNHYLTKPIDLAELYRLISQYFSATPQPTTPSISVANTITQLENDTQFQALVERFNDGLSEQITRMECAVLQQDWPTLRSIAHVLKGTAKSFGYPHITTTAATLLSQIENHQHKEAIESFTKLRKCCQPVSNTH